MANKDNQVIKSKPVEVKASVVAATVKARTNVYELMYEIAKEHARLAKNRVGGSMDDMRIEIKESMVSLVFTHSCLETYINTRGYDGLRDQYNPYWDWLDKWNKVATALSNGRFTSVFNEKQKPFSLFKELDILRNKLLHFKGHFGHIRKTKYGRTEGMINWCNHKKAEWSCMVVEEMIKKLCDSIGEKYPAWLEGD